jgi:hypothetical protein
VVDVLKMKRENKGKRDLGGRFGEVGDPEIIAVALAAESRH